MQCKDCNCCKLGHFNEMPNDYVCTGVKHPFIINDINHQCTEYPEKAEKTANEVRYTSSHYDKLIQNLNTVKWELKERNDMSLNLCIKYIKDAIIEAGRLNAQYANLSAEYDTFRFISSLTGKDDADCWCD